MTDRIEAAAKAISDILAVYSSEPEPPDPEMLARAALSAADALPTTEKSMTIARCDKCGFSHTDFDRCITAAGDVPGTRAMEAARDIAKDQLRTFRKATADAVPGDVAGLVAELRRIEKVLAKHAAYSCGGKLDRAADTIEQQAATILMLSKREARVIERADKRIAEVEKNLKNAKDHLRIADTEIERLEAALKEKSDAE